MQRSLQRFQQQAIANMKQASCRSMILNIQLMANPLRSALVHGSFNVTCRVMRAPQRPDLKAQLRKLLDAQTAITKYRLLIRNESHSCATTTYGFATPPATKK